MTELHAEASLGTFSGPTTLQIKRWLPGRVDRVWAYLTDSDLRRKWLAAGDLPNAAGQSFELVWRNGELSRENDPRPAGSSEEQRMQSRVIAIEPKRSLTIAWGGGDVRFDLEQQGERVLLTITHSGINERGGKIMIGAGWHTHLDILVAEMEGRQPVSFWSTWAALKPVYELLLPEM